MRDDRITVYGPHPVPSFEVEAHVDEDGEFIPAHTADMSRYRTMGFEALCRCGEIHGYTLKLPWEMMVAYPELITEAITSAMRLLMRSIEDCNRSLGPHSYGPLPPPPQVPPAPAPGQGAR